MTANPADAVREALERIESECGNRGDSAYNEMDVDAIREFILDLTNEADRLAALAGAAPVAWNGSALDAVLDGGQPVAWRVRTPYGVGYKFAPELISYMDNRDPEPPHAPAKAREDSIRALLLADDSDGPEWNAAIRAALATFAEGAGND